MKLRLGHILATLLLVTAFASGCKEDPPDPETLTFNLQVNGLFNNQNFQYNTDYTAPDGNVFNFVVLKFYISNIRMIGTDNTQTKIERDAILVDLGLDEAGTTYALTVPFGEYKGFVFDAGLSPALNGTDPAAVPADDDLSSLRNMYWTWASRYIFMKLEGSAIGPATNNASEAFVFHTGNDDFHQPDALRSEQLFSAGSDGDLQAAVAVDAMKLFYGANDTIDVGTENVTHTTDDFDLAARVMDNLGGAFSDD